MDILDFSEEIKNFKHSGVTFNLEERMQLEIALGELQAANDFEELVFWGKINGLKTDYFIAMAIKFKDMYEFPVKTFYFCTGEDFTFKEMPDLTSAHDHLIDIDTSYFTGEPARLLGKKKEGEEDGEEEKQPEEPVEDDQANADIAKNSDESSEEEIVVPTKPLAELDRLTTVVHAIENDCQVAPCGAFKMTPSHQVCRNEGFRGLSAADAANLSSYLHFRNVQSEEKRAILEEATTVFNERFLDEISQDQPQGCWTVQKDEREENVIVRSLMWPGYQFYHKIGSNKFGAVYVGDGLKNAELHFIIQ